MRSYFIESPFWLAYCKRIFGDDLPALNINFTNSYFGGMNITGSNIFFVNAVEDPWQFAGMREIYNPKLQSGMEARLINCTNCGHCIDLGTPKSDDPIELTTVRDEVAVQLKAWLDEDKLNRKIVESLELLRHDNALFLQL